jgi:hypothetical protein
VDTYTQLNIIPRGGRKFGDYVDTAIQSQAIQCSIIYYKRDRDHVPHKKGKSQSFDKVGNFFEEKSEEPSKFSVGRGCVVSMRVEFSIVMRKDTLIFLKSGSPKCKTS